MLILSLDTADGNCMIAISKNDTLIDSVNIVKNANPAEFLVSRIENLLLENNLSYSNIERIAVTVGPGKFTGIRIALSVALGISNVINVPIVSLTNFELLAFSAFKEFNDDAKLDYNLMHFNTKTSEAAVPAISASTSTFTPANTSEASVPVTSTSESVAASANTPEALTPLVSTSTTATTSVDIPATAPISFVPKEFNKNFICAIRSGQDFFYVQTFNSSMKPIKEPNVLSVKDIILKKNQDIIVANNFIEGVKYVYCVNMSPRSLAALAYIKRNVSGILRPLYIKNLNLTYAKKINKVN